MDIHLFSQKVLRLSERLSWLLDPAIASTWHQPDRSMIAFKELGVAIEELQVAVEELQRQNEALVESVASAAVERSRYQQLFQFAPQAYLVTNLKGEIQEANHMTAQLLGCSAELLIGKPMVLFIDKTDRPNFWAELLRREHQDQFQEWEIWLHPRDQMPIAAACTIVTIRDNQEKATGFRWALRDITKQKRLEKLMAHGTQDYSEDDSLAALLESRPSHQYRSGDIIPLQPLTLWYVTEGFVKLTTLTEQNKEVLLGFIGPGMPFGPFLTALPVYEATAQSDVQLFSLELTEITASPHLVQLLFVKTAHRLQQAENLLSISGDMSVQQRLCQFLKLLAAEAGHPVEQGVRLGIRLTHEDLASGCGSTRVTVTKLLGKLQTEGIITFDDQHHIIMLQG